MFNIASEFRDPIVEYVKDDTTSVANNIIIRIRTFESPIRFLEAIEDREESAAYRKQIITFLSVEVSCSSKM